MTIIVVAASLALVTMPSIGQPASILSLPDAPPRFSYGSSIDEWLEREPTMRQQGDRGPLEIWLGQAPEGLAVAARVSGGNPRYEATAETLRRGDHLELALTWVPEVEFPPIGWGNQFGQNLVEEDGGCEKLVPSGSGNNPEQVTEKRRQCESWLTGQYLHRARLERLFVRHWLLAPSADRFHGLAVEQSALPAFAGLDLAAQQRFEPLRPTGQPRIHGSRLPDQIRQQNGYTLEVMVPWEAMPPANRLTSSQLYLQLVVHRHTNSELSTPKAVDLPRASSDSWSRLDFATPKKLLLGACRAPLSGWIRPQREPQVDSSFELANEEGGYWYEPQGLSPGIKVTEHFRLLSADNPTLCGPHLALLSNGERRDIWLENRPTREPIEVPRETRARRIGERLLVAVGPRTFWSRFGSGQCGACPRYEATIYEVQPTGATKQLFDVRGVVAPGSPTSDADVHLSGDWKRVTVYKAASDPNLGMQWTSSTFCLGETSYTLCGHGAEAPAERNLTPNEGW